MSVTCVLGYTPVISEGAGRPIKNSLLMLSLEYGPVYLWLAYCGWVAIRKKLAVASLRSDSLTSDIEAIR
jgi:hypothetical protein